MATLKRLALVAASAAGLAVYVWFGAVRNVPAVKRRKALRRKRLAN